jgi:DNA-directed RNA polymerase subunit M/transcription elongation factor TFIIS
MNIETKTYSDGTTATGPAPLPDHSPRQQDECPKCGTDEWDRITNRVAPGEVFNRCARCGNEWEAQ